MRVERVLLRLKLPTFLGPHRKQLLTYLRVGPDLGSSIASLQVDMQFDSSVSWGPLLSGMIWAQLSRPRSPANLTESGISPRLIITGCLFVQYGPFK